MKVLLFTHKNDIDGMGNAVLSKIAFDNVDYVLCGTFDLIKKVNECINSRSIYNYDRIFITDLCLDVETLNIIDKDKNLKNKVKIFDHHKTYDNKNYTKFSFLKIEIKNDIGLSCGTSIFYKYLVTNNFIKPTAAIDEFVELTRQHDTWEWKNIYNNHKARDLSLLFNALGTSGYINDMYEKLTKVKLFNFNKTEKSLITNKKFEIEEAMEDYLNNIYYRTINNLKVGIIFISYEHRNEIGDYLRSNKYDMDLVMMISLDKKVVSYRSVKENVCVREIAELYGGKGHDKAATNAITNEQKEKIIDILTKI